MKMTEYSLHESITVLSKIKWILRKSGVISSVQNLQDENSKGKLNLFAFVLPLFILVGWVPAVMFLHENLDNLRELIEDVYPLDGYTWGIGSHVCLLLKRGKIIEFFAYFENIINERMYYLQCSTKVFLLFETMIKFVMLKFAQDTN